MGILLACGYKIKDKTSRKNFFFFVASVFLGKYLLILGNESFQFIENKKAGNFTIWYYTWLGEKGLKAFLEAHLNSTFYTQLIANIPGFHFFGASRTNLLLTNSFFTSLTGLMAFFTFHRHLNKKTAWWALLLFSLYPTAICFSIFGLRDPLLYFFMTGYVLFFFQCIKEWQIKKGMILALFIGLILQTRPESAAFIFLPLISWGLFKFFDLCKKNKTWKGIRFSTKKFWILTSLIIIFGSIGLYTFVLFNFGTNKLMSPVQFLELYANQRYSLTLNTIKESSNFLPPEIHFQLPWIVRWPIQILGIIITPFPWLINNIWKLLAFFDSALIILLLWYAKKNISLPSPNRIVAILLILTFIAGIMIMGVLICNAGNAFRLRLSLVPFLFVAVLLQLNKNIPLPSWLSPKK